MSGTVRSALARRLAFAFTAPMLVAGLLVDAPPPGAAAVPTATKPRAEGLPPTVSLTIPVSLRGLVHTPQALRIRDGALLTNKATRTGSQTLCPGFRFTGVGLVWHQKGVAGVRAIIRTGLDRARFGPGSVVESEPDEGPSPGYPDYHPHRQAAGLLWTGPRRCVRLSLRLPGGIALSRLRAAFVNTSGTAGLTTSADTVDAGTGTPALAPKPAWKSGPAIITRGQWGANPRYFDTGTPGCRAPYYSPRVKVAFVHHTAGSNDYSGSQADDVVRAIYWFHTQERGFCDIAYNFLISRYGQIFEGRAGGISQPVTPGSQAGFNPDTFSVSVMGNFQIASPTRATFDAMKRLLAWRLDVAHVPALGKDTLVSQGGDTTRYSAGTKVTMDTIVGHRVTGLTSCPGILLFRDIPAIRRAAAATGLPKILRPQQSTVRFRPGSGKVRLIARGTARLAWTASVRTRAGGVVRTLHDHGKYLGVTWDGKDGGGQTVPPAKYRVVVSGRARGGHAALPAMFPVELPGSASRASTSSFSPPMTSVDSANASRGFRVLDAVAGTGAADVWAVGGTMTGPVRGHALVMHRTSAGWRSRSIRAPGKVSSFLSGVAATSAAVAWAVGFRCGAPSCAGGGFGERTLIERGTAGTWQAIASPNPGTGADRLNAVVVLSPSDAWAVGDQLDEGIYLHQPLLEHWDGTRWTAVAAPRVPGVDVHMTDILARSDTDILAVGHGCLGNRGCGGAPAIRPVVAHFDGGRWRMATTARVRAAASSLEAVAASGGGLLAVGWRAKTRHSNSRPLAERRAGGRWRIESAPRSPGILFGVGGVRGAPAWGVGDRMANGQFRTLTVRRTRGGWRAVRSPSPPGRMSALSSVAVLSRKNAWAVGPSVTGPLLLHWNGARWRLVRPG